ncbi:MAG: major capsid protein, partial [bacterium]|nr:major capsid protein [bacterium]
MGLYDTTQLVAALDAMDRPQAFLRDMFFARRVLSNDEEIAIDKLLKRRKMAPFVSPDVPAKERALRGRKVETFVPATLKPMGTIRPNDMVKRAHGEKIGGGISPAERRPGVVNQLLSDQDDEITRREEWMCANTMRTGIITVSGEDYETQVVDYGRTAAHTTVLTGVNRWGESGVSILDNIGDWAAMTQKACGGVVV